MTGAAPGLHRVMLVGESNAGKSALIQALYDANFTSHKALALEYCGPFVNTPGEFLENRFFYRALITTAAECAALLMVQDATRNTSLFPPKFASMFNRSVFGVITKADSNGANVPRAKLFLKNAGVTVFFPVCVKTGKGLQALREHLEPILASGRSPRSPDM